ncbi:MAG TPA: histidine kinase [Actinophytocola sp.]|uniref:sensor histidine kinase n=1 Tax=Actinophytocola sp. TaxID=1872138 RepID=UPI002DB83143|nr:histidine kinase [Actinophytocola sp.]HEU5470472.1 histidine kinase [Actinophytocola sp.]
MGRHHRWLLALFGAAFVVDFVVARLTGAGAHLLGAAGMLVCVAIGLRRPGVAAGIAAGVLAISAQVDAGTPPGWVGIEGLGLSEVLAGVALLVLLCWREPPRVAAAGVAALVLGCLAATGLRAEFPPDGRTLSFGFAVLVCGTAAGWYLRRPVRSDWDVLLRRQWPLVAVLAVLLLVGVDGSGDHLWLPGLGAALVSAVCAVLAPRSPVRAALTTAAVTGILAVPGFAEPLLRPVSGLVTVHVLPSPFVPVLTAATVVLILTVVRYARPLRAAVATAALAVAGTGPVTVFEARMYLVISLGIAVFAAVVAGLWLRAQDREHTRSVTGARQAERLALARELHDVVAHHVTGIVVAAQAARLVADRDPAVATGALEKIESSGEEALTAMRRLVGSLRGADVAGSSTATATGDLAADIRALVAGFTGPTVHLELDLPATLPHEMGRSVLRLVQESLTNVAKHARGATSVFVGITEGRGEFGPELHLFVNDDGRSDPAARSEGYGLVGMRERVELLGGWFGAGPAGDGGWVVKVALPLWEAP